MEEFKIFKFKGIELGYETLLGLLGNKQQFRIKYPLFNCSKHLNTYVISDQNNTVYVYKKPIKIIIQSEKIQKSFSIYSDLDIDNYCSNNNIDKNNLFLENGENFIDWNKIISSNETEIKLIYKEKKELIINEPSIILEEGQIYPVSKYSKNYYKDYFGNDAYENMEFRYENTVIRKIIFENLNNLFSSQCTKFKFTGPFNIGKSITLLQYSRLNEDVFYFNLKVLSNKSDYDCYMILIEEFSRIDGKFYKSVIDIIESNYNKGEKPLNVLFNIMIHLSGYNIVFIFIFDQYKSNSFSIGLKEKLEKLSSIKFQYKNCLL